MRWRTPLIALLLIAVTWAVFGQVHGFEFVMYDDMSYVYENSHVLGGLTSENVRWAFSREAVPVTANWHPLTWLSLMLDTELFGTDPGGYHLSSVVLHTANTLLLFLLMIEMTGAVWKSGVVAALFAIHPLHVESVAWVSERKDVLSTLFGLLAMLAYVRYTRPSGKRWAWYAASIVAFMLSLLAKQTLVTLPFVLLLLDYWPLGRTQWETTGEAAANSGEPAGEEEFPDAPRLTPDDGRRSWQRLVVEKLPYFAITILFCGIAFWSQHSTKAMIDLEVYPLDSRIRNTLEVYVLYLVKTLWPQNLAYFHPHLDSIPLVRAVGAGLLLLLVSFGALIQRRRHPYLVVGWFWYLGTLVPMVGLVQIGIARMAERYMYIPLIGIFMAVAWGVPLLFPEGRARRVVLPSLTVLVLLVLSAAAWRQAGFWRDSETLFRHAISATNKNDLAHHQLANLLYEAGRYDEAVKHLNAVLEIYPREEAARNLLGLIYIEQGRYEDAIAQFLFALSVDDSDADAHNNLGLAFESNGQPEEAYESFQKALEVDPKNAVAHYNLGNLWADQNQMDKAIVELERAVELEPDSAKFHNNLGLALLVTGRLEEALHHVSRAREINPKDALAHFNLGQVKYEMGNLQEAAKHLQEAVRLDPEHDEARKLLDHCRKLMTSGTENRQERRIRND